MCLCVDVVILLNLSRINFFKRLKHGIDLAKETQFFMFIFFLQFKKKILTVRLADVIKISIFIQK